jgi:predicted esterase
MLDTMDEHIIDARTHGRYLCEPPATADAPWPLIVGFHGFAENAEIHLDALRALPGAADWLLASVQALHPFYTPTQRIVASWMTRQHREQAIADNIDYVTRVVAAVRARYDAGGPLVFAGFSQGGAMAYRAAAACRADGVLVLGADVPPDVDPAMLPPVLIGRGTDDEWYAASTLDADVATLRAGGVRVDTCVFDGGHEWGAAFRDAAGAWLDRIRTTATASGARAPR